MLPLLLACAAPSSSEARSALLQAQMIRENRIYEAREPQALAQKYKRMALDRYDFMRGTAGWFYADVSRAGGAQQTAGVLEQEATQVLVVGDPHPENLGTLLIGEMPASADEVTLSLEWVDLDAVGWGPWTLDLRRGALGLAAMLDPLEGCDCTQDAVKAMAEGYAAGLAAEAPAYGPITLDLLAEAAEEGLERKRLDDRAPVYLDETERRFRLDEDLDELGRGMLPATDAELARVQAVAEALLPADTRLLAVCRRWGSGIASLPAARFQLLADTGQPGPDDDLLLQVREVWDPPLLAAAGPPSPLFQDNAERVTAGQALWSQTERYADATLQGNLAFKLTSAGSYFQTFDHEKVAEAWAEGELQPQDLIDLGFTLGHALGAAHLRGGTSTGDPVSWQAPDPSELAAIAASDLQTLEADHQAFLLLVDDSALLGAERIP